MSDTIIFTAKLDALGHILSLQRKDTMQQSDNGNTLTHVGVLGMHWGVRKALGVRGPASADHIQTQQLRKKHVTELSNKEIQAITTRLSLEKQLSSLDPKVTGTGRKILNNLLTKYGPMALGYLIKKYVMPKDPFNASQDGYSVVDSLPILDANVKQS